MNFASLLISFVVTAFVSQAHSNQRICDTLVVCGSYSEEPSENGVTLKIDFLPKNEPNEINFAWKYFKNGVDTGGGVNLVLKFNDDGSFTAMMKDKLYASGVCRNQACTYGITPIVRDDGTLLTQTGTFRFRDNKLALSVFAPDFQDGDFVSKGVLEKN